MDSSEPVRAHLLIIDNLGRTFQTPDGRPRFDVSINAMRVGPQEFAVICGHTGCGKSTLHQQVAARDRPSRVGTFRLGSDDVFAAWRNERAISAVRRRIGATSQRPVLFDCLSAGENVAVRRRLAGQPQDSDWLQFILEELSCTDHHGRPDLPHLMHQPVHRISGGQAQRLEIAREIYHEPDLLVLDEPTSALDPATGQKVVRFLNRLCQEHGMTVLLVTHDLELVRPYATQVIRMATNELRQGVIVSTERFAHPAA